MKKYIHYGSKEYIPQIMKPIKNDFLPKPQGGLWASSIDATYSWKSDSIVVMNPDVVIVVND